MKRFNLFVLTISLSLGLVFSVTNFAIAIGEVNLKGGSLERRRILH